MCARTFLSFSARSLALGTVMGGQQVCNQACRLCNGGGVTVTAQQEIFFAMDWASFFWGAETSVHVHAVLVAGSGVDFFCFDFF